MKNYKIAVAGTGYVGLSLGVLLSQHHQVVAVDIVQAKVDMINNKKSPIQDDYIEKYLAEKDLNLTATLDAKAAYTVAKASQGLADYLKKNYAEPSVAIGYDSRLKSDVFAKVAAGVFAANGVKVNIWPVLMPVPTVSFATRYLHTSAGVMVTASHNPSKYNGYKVYGADGCQITTEAAAEILAEIRRQRWFCQDQRQPIVQASPSMHQSNRNSTRHHPL